MFGTLAKRLLVMNLVSDFVYWTFCIPVGDIEFSGEICRGDWVKCGYECCCRYCPGVA